MKKPGQCLNTLKDKNNMDDDVEIINEGDEETFKDKLKKLKDELKAAKSERDDYLAGWQRAKADFINARKDEERARTEFAKFAAEGILLEMLKVADSLELAGESSGPIYAQLREIFKEHGVVPVESQGKKFNPLEHEALEEKEVLDEKEDNVVAEELQKGWRIYDRILRPAKVKVGVYKNKN
ncbi:MAG: GrpE protein HSP-70 cofactor [Candidatus Giovannonibacteria bacterium GW2011_GWA1_43_15]|uniref:Protein GrpE n=2 Tax=Candidatus Giovannoniibacteriota TaxID=1752738 RepID=A0A0G1IWC0_9BACT|nr:MAG: GrpE protein HSP-70 cofactor [Candidatus Giovannonibacteria bacterium GW2011_GWB1_43_13]KKS99449.1 MAG: GrpE protein HSP-70 cofactor [Candidatus Giovannonibacteria bacterium GW2011_GWA1_43_15]KKT63370.1 MAG: GrpE protein HSP-70 cofactor [Candidatus Giovannonibacteria bacterium GW2011_GWA2_44_26]